MNEWYDKYREGAVTDFSEGDADKGELEGLGPFIFLVVLLAVAFVMDMLM